ncbi:MAG: ribosome maturation factor RimP [Propionibacteriaceae bacterium]|nr:ribosome maturation factor RimP [Propionibacteriaceae bacterium]
MSSLHEEVESVLMRQGLDLEDLTQTKLGSRSLVRITIDGDGVSGQGLNLDEVAAVSRELSQALDESEVMGEQAYVLEVGTRGVESPLTKPAQWRRNVSRLVTITLLGDEVITGRISEATQDSVTLTDGQIVAYADIKKALIQVEMKAQDREEKE